jgi:hypothetical protein
MGTSKDILINEIFEIKEEKDMLINENKNFASFLGKYLELTQAQIEDIAYWGFTNLHRKEEE